MALHVANNEEWQPRAMRLLFQEALGKAAHRGNAPLHQVCANQIWFALCPSVITRSAGGFNVHGARKLSRNDLMWRAVILTLSRRFLFFFVSYNPLLKPSVLVRLLMGVNSAPTVSKTLPRGTSTCYAIMVTVQERTGRNSGPRNPLRVNQRTNPSSHGKWRVPEILDTECFLVM